MFNVLGTFGNNTCFFHSGKWHEIVFIWLHKYGGISHLKKLAIYCQNEKLKNENLKKMILEIFQLLEVRGKKEVKIVRFIYVVFIV
jgi:hypothetical protein